MSLTLYVGSKRLSSWSMRPYLVLAQSGASFETKTIHLDRPGYKDELAKVSPTGRVPVLVHDGLLLPDSIAICEYIHELYPAAKLWPADRAQRARARSLAAEMHSGFAALRTNMPMDLCRDKAGQGHTPEALADARRVQAIWREAIGASGGPFLFGAFTIADAMYAPVTTRFTTYGVDVDDTARAYIAAIAGLPAMQAWRADAEQEPAL